MVSSVEKHVRAKFGDKADIDEDILAYMITCLEDETFKFDENGEEIYDTVGDMLVRCNSSRLCTDFQCALWMNSHFSIRLDNASCACFHVVAGAFSLHSRARLMQHSAFGDY
jgi:hypothetical protein